jgi:hypothetical protein
MSCGRMQFGKNPMDMIFRMRLRASCGRCWPHEFFGCCGLCASKKISMLATHSRQGLLVGKSKHRVGFGRTELSLRLS